MIAKHRRAVRPREDRLGHVAPDLAPVDVPRRDNLDVPGPITAQIPMQKPDRLIRPAVRIMRHALHQRRSEEHTSELQSLVSISYAVFCLQTKKILSI